MSDETESEPQGIFSRSLGRFVKIGDLLTLDEQRMLIADMAVAVALLEPKRRAAKHKTDSAAGADAANAKRKASAKKQADAAIWLLKALLAGGRSADEAIALMIEQGHKKSTLRRQLKPELAKLGRTRKPRQAPTPRKKQ